MKNEQYLHEISFLFGALEKQIELLKGLNLQDIGIVSENLFRDILNVTFGWNLKNVNEFVSNYEAIDL